MAVKSPARSITYADLEQRSNRLANALLGLGLQRGDRVGIYLPNCVEVVEIEIACYKAGLIKAPFNARLSPTEVGAIAANSGAALIVTTAERAETIRPHVAQSMPGAMPRLLLTDVREAVSTLRESGALDLSAALRPLAENVPALDIRMDIESPLTLDDPERAHVLLRCTQEIITNTVRHSGARHLWIEARRDDGCVHIKARDDGRGADALVAGNGLRGMRERIAQYGGTIEIETRPGAGFRLDLRLPASATQVAACEGVSG